MLFNEIKFKGQKAKNRIVMAPMCQYCAQDDGLANDWHFVHYATRAIGQVGIITTEAAAIEPKGRVTNNDLGIWDDTQIEPLRKISRVCKHYGSMIGVQVNHAGRKSGVEDKQIVGPSPIAFKEKYPVPRELSKEDIEDIISKYEQATLRAQEAEFDFIELHAAHGYLINEFLSPLANQRTDEYGKDRSLFLKKVVRAVRNAWPEEKPVFLKITTEEYKKDGNHPKDLVSLLNPVKDMIDLIEVSSGAIIDDVKIHTYPGYQVKYSEYIKNELMVPTSAVGLITSPLMAEEILSNKRADTISLGRELLRNPYWPLTAARVLGEQIEWPHQYERSRYSLTKYYKHYDFDEK